MNYLKNAIDFAMTVQIVKDQLYARNKNNFGLIGINARLIQRISSDNFFVRINFDFYNNTNHSIPEDYYVIIEWNGNQYVLKYHYNAIELDGYEH